MRYMLKFAALGAISMILVNCGGSNGTTPSPETPTTPTGPSMTDSYSMTVNTLVQNISAETGALGGAEEVEAVFVWKAGDENFTATVTAFGRTVKFNQNDINAAQDTLEKDIKDTNTTLVLSLLDDTFEDFLGGTKEFDHLSRFRVFDFDNDTETSNIAFGIFGEERATNMLPSTQATYSGSVIGSRMLKSDDVQAYILDADFSVDVDFESREVTNGLISNVTLNGFEDDVEYLLDDTTLTDTGFKTTLRHNPDACDEECFSVNDSELKARFYGPAAEELGAEFSMEGTDVNGEDFVAIGVIASKKASD